MGAIPLLGALSGPVMRLLLPGAAEGAESTLAFLQALIALNGAGLQFSVVPH